MSAKINMETIQQLRELGEDGEDFLGEMLGMYLKNTEEKIASLPALFQAGKFKDIQAFCHQLKASSGNVGATSIQEAAEKLEASAAGANKAAIEEGCRFLTENFPLVAAELRAILQKK